jgi:hypothetical protein
MLSGMIEPGETLRVWAMAEDGGQGGFNCGFETNIWDDHEDDLAVLFDAYENEMGRK